MCPDGWDPRAVSLSPQLKPRDEVKSVKRGVRVRARDTGTRCERMESWVHGIVVCRMLGERGGEKTQNWWSKRL